MTNACVLIILMIAMAAGCGHLSGAGVADDEKARGIRYYVARPQFIVTKATAGDAANVTVAVRRDPDLRYPQEVYLSQGWFSADVFDARITEHGLLTAVSGEATDQSVESFKSVASFAVQLASTFAGTGALALAQADSAAPAALADRGMSARARRATPNTTCSVAISPERPGIFLRDLRDAAKYLGKQAEALSVDAKAIASAEQDKRPSIVDARYTAQGDLATLESCLKVLKTEAPRRGAEIARLSDADIAAAHNAIAADLDLKLQTAVAGAAASRLSAALGAGFVSLTPAEAIAEMTKQLADETDPKARSALALESTIAALKGIADGSAVAELQQVVAKAAQPCGQGQMVAVSQIIIFVRIVEADLDCLLNKQTTSDVRKDPQFLATAPAALQLLHTYLELLLDPAAGRDDASRRAGDALKNAGVQLDPRFCDETLLHLTLRARDRLHEFGWRRAEGLAAARAFDARAAKVHDARGRLAEIWSVLQQRDHLRRFLLKPIDAAEVKARGRAQDQLTALNAALVTLLTVADVPPEPVGRTFTPQIYWVMKHADIPGGPGVGNPGDVLVIMRPVGAERPAPPESKRKRIHECQLAGGAK